MITPDDVQRAVDAILKADAAERRFLDHAQLIVEIQMVAVASLYLLAIASLFVPDWWQRVKAAVGWKGANS